MHGSGNEMGLVDQVVPASDLDTATYALAQEVAENSPLSITTMKHTLSRLRQEQGPSPELAAQLDEMLRRAETSEDAREGPRAFLEKRKPRFTGRYPPAPSP